VARLVRLVAQLPSIDTGFLAKAAPQDEAPNVTRVDEKSLETAEGRLQCPGWRVDRGSRAFVPRVGPRDS
jgi:glutamate formiminotransferase